MKKLLSLLLAVLLVFTAALPAFAAPNGEDDEFGVAKGYVRTKEAWKSSSGETTTITRTLNKQGKTIKEVETFKSESSSSRRVITFAFDKKCFLV